MMDLEHMSQLLVLDLWRFVYYRICSYRSTKQTYHLWFIPTKNLWIIPDPKSEHNLLPKTHYPKFKPTHKISAAIPQKQKINKHWQVQNKIIKHKNVGENNTKSERYKQPTTNSAPFSECVWSPTDWLCAFDSSFMVIFNLYCSSPSHWKKSLYHESTLTFDLWNCLTDHYHPTKTYNQPIYSITSTISPETIYPKIIQTVFQDMVPSEHQLVTYSFIYNSNQTTTTCFLHLSMLIFRITIHCLSVTILIKFSIVICYMIWSH